jgi:tetratricopeptide (TPR) repeat protein
MPCLLPAAVSHRYAAFIVALALLAGCAGGPTPVSPESPAAATGSPSAPTPAAPRPTAPLPSSAVDALLAEARGLRGEGRIEASLSRLERALRIAPERAEVYLELARSHRASGQDTRATASAERGLLYCQARVCVELYDFLER